MPIQTDYSIAGFPRYRFHIDPDNLYTGKVWNTKLKFYVKYGNNGHGRNAFKLTNANGEYKLCSLARVACLAILGFPPTDKKMRPYLHKGKVTSPQWVTQGMYSRFTYPNVLKPCQFWAIANAIHDQYEKCGEINQSELARKFCVSRSTIYRIKQSIGY